MADNANKDAHDTQNNIKKEFYTREGLWKSLRHSEYTKPYATSTTTAIGNTNAQSAIQSVYNNADQVKLSFIRLANHTDKNGCVRIRCIHCNKLNSPDMSNKVNVACESCNHTLKLAHDNADYLMFNYSKELYLYYFNGIDEQVDNPKILVDKKMYKSLSVICHDINKEANVANGSLLVAVGFSKGEIHVYDAFKKDSSLFFNNNSNDKLNDRTKATCIKWIPKTLNLFLVSHTSGHMYLYDIDLVQQQALTSQQSQQSSANPVYQVVSEGDCFKIETNVSIVKNSKNLIQNENQSMTKQTAVQLTQQQQNPLVKWTIKLPLVDNAQCPINEFSFSPDAQHLAIACQDGYLRVFNYAEMQIKCQMKSYFGGLLCACWSHDGKYIATGGEDDLITVYSFYEQRVACRGRGHSSWVNSVQFDYWTSYYMNDLLKINENDGDSDFEDYHQNANDIGRTSANKKSNIRQHSASTSSYPNKRYSSLSEHDQMHMLSKINIYRLGSIGQDNRIAFWDLNDDVLKEKSHLRSRVTSIALNSLTITSPPIAQIRNEVEQPNSFKTEGGFLKKSKRYTSLNLSKKIDVIGHNGGSHQQSQQTNKLSKTMMNLICPKLDEIPLIEPLICKRIAYERLTGLLFKDDCFLVASQDGLVSTWSRPNKSNPKNILEQNEINVSVEKIHVNQNSTCL